MNTINLKPMFPKQTVLLICCSSTKLRQILFLELQSTDCFSRTFFIVEGYKDISFISSIYSIPWKIRLTWFTCLIKSACALAEKTHDKNARVAGPTEQKDNWFSQLSDRIRDMLSDDGLCVVNHPMVFPSFRSVHLSLVAIFFSRDAGFLIRTRSKLLDRDNLVWVTTRETT
jgi:hypothetical protein